MIDPTEVSLKVPELVWKPLVCGNFVMFLRVVALFKYTKLTTTVLYLIGIP